MKQNKYFNLDFINGKIYGTEKSFNHAGLGHGAAYKELMQLKAAHPDYVYEVREEKKKAEKETARKGLTKEFIVMVVEETEDADLIAEMNAEIEVATESKENVYPKLKAWFYGKENFKKEYGTTALIHQKRVELRMAADETKTNQEETETNQEETETNQKVTAEVITLSKETA